MVFVVLYGLPINVDPTHLAEKINLYFGKNEEIGTFRMNIDYFDINKPKAVLMFKQSFDAMEAQRLLDNFMYVNTDNLIYIIKSIVPTNDEVYKSLFSEEIPDTANVIMAEKLKPKKKKRKHSPIDNNILTKDSDVSNTALKTADIGKLKKLCKKLKKEAKRSASQSDHSASESESRKKIRDECIYGESSGVSKRPRSPEDTVPKKSKRNSEQRTVESPKTSISITCGNRERSRSTTTDSLSPFRRSSISPMAIPKQYKRPHSPDDAGSSTSFDSKKVNVGGKGNRRLSESQSSDVRVTRPLSTFERAIEDLKKKVETRKSLEKDSKLREFASYYGEREVHVSSPRGRGRGGSHSGQNSRSEKDSRSSNESTDSEYTTAPDLCKKLLLLHPSTYLSKKDPEFREAVQHIIDTVAINTERLQEEDKKLIIDNYTTTVSNRLKSLKFTNLMSVQDIVVDYKLVYKTADDKLLINNLIKELQAMGKGVLMPEIKQERLHQAIDEVLQTTDIDELMKDVKEDIKPEIEKTLEYEYEDGDTTEVINIVVNLVPIEKRDLPYETDPEKVANIKVFVSKLRKTKPQKFYRPIRSLLNEMKLFMYNNAKVVPSEVILNRMVEVLQKILARMMGPIKTRVKTKDVCNLFRNSFPYKEDREFVDMVIKWIVDGEFDKGAIDGLITEKLPDIERNIIKTEENKNALFFPASIKAEPRNIDSTDTAEPTQPAPIKTESTNNQTENQLEQTVLTNISVTEEQTIVQIKPEEQSNIYNDIGTTKESLEVISIDDDEDLGTKKQPIKDKKTSRVKLETINISDSEDEGAQSDDSRTTQVIETKPFVDYDSAFGLDENIDRAPMPNAPLKSELSQPSDIMGQDSDIKGQASDITGQPSDITGQPSDITGQPSDIMSQPSDIMSQPSDITSQASDITGQQGDILGELGETIDDIRRFLKAEKK